MKEKGKEAARLSLPAQHSRKKNSPSQKDEDGGIQKSDRVKRDSKGELLTLDL